MHDFSKREFKDVVTFAAEHSKGEIAKLCRDFLHFDWGDTEYQKIINAIDIGQTSANLAYTDKQRNSLRNIDKCRVGNIAFGLGVIFGAAYYGHVEG